MAEAQISLNADQWADWRWRLHNLYWIVDEHGRRIRFKPNEVQTEFIDSLWYLNLVLKARQEGFTTVIDILALDQCVFNSHQTAAIIAHRLEDAGKIFRTKVKFAYDNLPDALKTAQQTDSDTRSSLTFENKSSISVGTSARSGTLTFLHVSEYGYICAKHPDKADEIKTGSLNAVSKGQYVFIESTAYGRYGDFFDKCEQAKHVRDEGLPLSELDFKFHFYAWWRKPSYTLDPKIVTITSESREYFKRLELEHDVRLSEGQKAWYVKKAEQMGDKMKREFPSTPEEAFEVAIEGAYYHEQMAWLRKHNRIRQVPHTPGVPVNTFWDLGRNDTTVLWFHQFVASEHRFIDYYENSGEALAHYVKVMQDRAMADEYIYGRHFLPHDAENENLERGESRVDRLVELRIPSSKIVVVERVEDINVGIELVRKVLPTCFFDKEKCNEGIAGLDSYRKEWDEKQETWKSTPLHNWASNPADAFRQFAQGWAPAARLKPKREKRRGWRTV